MYTFVNLNLQYLLYKQHVFEKGLPCTRKKMCNFIQNLTLIPHVKSRGQVNEIHKYGRRIKHKKQVGIKQAQILCIAA